MFDVIANVLAWFYSLVGDYAIAIVLLTLLIMLLFTPLTIKGVTFRNRVMSTSHACGLEEGGLPLEERQITVEELESADEVWISSTGHEVWPVGAVNDRVIGNGAAGVVWQKIDDLFQASKR